MSVGEICNRDVVIVERAAAVAEAAQLMRQFHVGDLVVVEPVGERRRPVGILSDRDIVVEVVAEQVASEQVTVGDIMSADLMTAGEGDDLFDTIRRMRQLGVRRVPVVDAAGLLVGILAVDDLLDLLAEQLNGLVALVNNQFRHERQRRGA
jgi:predicted transcriptional regulator